MSKKLNNSQLAAWIYTPAATVSKLQQCYAHYALPAPVPANVAGLQPVIYAHLTGLAAPNAVASWQPVVATPAHHTPAVHPVTPVTHSIVNTTLPVATEGMHFSHNFTVNGYANPVSFSLLGAPAWLTINAVTGNLTAVVPTGTAGYHRFNVQATDGTTPSTAPVMLTVNAATAPVPVRTTNTPRIASWIPIALLIAVLAALLLLLGSMFLSRLGVVSPITIPVLAPLAAPVSAPAAVTNTKALKYDETGCNPSDLSACLNSGQSQFVAIYVRNIQSSDLTIEQGIVKIQQLVAASGVPSQDKWTNMTADPVYATFVWCPQGNCKFVPDTAFPLLGIPGLETVATKLAIVSAHMPADPKATILNVSCPAGDCWSFQLR